MSYEVGQVKCETLAELAQVCAEFVKQGVTFKASTSCLTITLTGGY